MKRMIQPAMNRLSTILSNPHTSWAGAIVILLQIAQIWAPTEWEPKLDKTSLIFLSYASVMAADGGKVKPSALARPEDRPTGV